FTFTFPVWITLVLTRRSWRAGFFQRLGGVRLPPPGKPRIWIHSVSVGEVLAARSLVQALHEDPRFEVVLSTTTRTGFEVASKRFPDLPRFHYPLDLSPVVRRVLRRVSPALIVMVELEVWPNFLLNADRMGIPVTFVNGRITRRSAESYPYLAWILRPLFRKTGLFCVQNEEYASRLLHLGASGDRIRITGNLKYDNLPGAPEPDAAKALAGDLGLADGEIVLVGGSIHPGEDEALVAAFRRLQERFDSARLVLVPRHPERFDRAEEIVRKAGLTVHRRTAGAPEGGTKPVLLIDTVGELGRIYAAANLVFVGGSLIPHGGQNMVEPATLGKPVLFGPHVHNFREDAAFLLDREAALRVNDEEALAEALIALAGDPARAEAMGKRGASAVRERRGATARTLKALETAYFKNFWPGREND
ncbi:MAG: 3-deoxy-D-manno-octulosonic acid transferase, partial [Planctomycetota bacterium]